MIPVPGPESGRFGWVRDHPSRSGLPGPRLDTDQRRPGGDAALVSVHPRLPAAGTPRGIE